MDDDEPAAKASDVVGEVGADDNKEIVDAEIAGQLDVDLYCTESWEDVDCEWASMDESREARDVVGEVGVGDNMEIVDAEIAGQFDVDLYCTESLEDVDCEWASMDESREARDVVGEVGVDDNKGEVVVIAKTKEEKERIRLKVDYMQTIQNDLNANDRGVMVDWLVNVAEGFQVVSNTIHLTVSYVDRYLSKKPINQQNLYLLGVTAMSIASKYVSSLDWISVTKCCDATNYKYTKNEVLHMEVDILNNLNYEMGDVTVTTFLRMFLKPAEVNVEYPLRLECLSYYLAELSLLDYIFVKFSPSKIAASAIFLAKFTIQPETHPWSSSLECYTGYKPSDLEECVVRIQEWQLLKRGESLRAVKNKYDCHKFQWVSTLRSGAEIPASYFSELGH